MKRRIEVTVEAERTFASIGRRGEQAVRWCPGCAATVAFAPADLASIACGVPTRLIYRRIELGTVHFIESARDLVVCLPSLVKTS